MKKSFQFAVMAVALVCTGAPALAADTEYKFPLADVLESADAKQKLDGSVKEPLRKLLKKRLDNPHVPGAALHGALTGHYKIKLKKHLKTT